MRRAGALRPAERKGGAVTPPPPRRCLPCQPRLACSIQETMRRAGALRPAERKGGSVTRPRHRRAMQASGPAARLLIQRLVTRARLEVVVVLWDVRPEIRDFPGRPCTGMVP